MSQVSLYWEEDAARTPVGVPDDVVDLAFRTDCRSLPVDHAYALSQAVQGILPWFANEPLAGLHLIHGADSGNGWYRPEGAAGDLLYLSRRTRFALRLPKGRLADARVLSGRALDVAGSHLVLGEASVRPLSRDGTIYARYVVGRAADPEAVFLEQVAAELRALGVRFKKVLCGRSHVLAAPEGEVYTRSVLLADLPPEDSIRLQQRGLGPGRKLGCGLFIAHKGLARVNPGMGGLF